MVCEDSESVSAASVPNCGFPLYLASSVYLSPSPQPSQNAYIDAPSLAAFPREKGVTAATPTGVTEHPAPCQPTLAAESKAKALTHTTADCKSVLEFFYFISSDGEPVSQCVQCVYIYVSNYSLYESAGFLCPSVYVRVCVWMVTLVSTLTSGVSLTSHHTNRPVRQDRRHHSNR